MVQVEVVYATAQRQVMREICLPDGSTARQAALSSGLAEAFPELDLQNCPLGIFGKRLQNPEAHFLQQGERVEIYRPLALDPKEIRRRRAAKST